MKYAIFDEKGLPRAFYDTEIHGNNIPKTAVRINKKQWLEFINNQNRRAYLNGQIIDITNKIWDTTANSWRDKTQEEILNEEKTQKRKQLLSLEKQRLQNILDQYGYNGLADVQLYASQNDAEAQAILSWYEKYDDLIWSYIDNDLSAFTSVDEFLQIEMKNIEEQIYQQSIQTSPLP